jgi:uncharacterized protein YegP (UPF0339 family)
MIESFRSAKNRQYYFRIVAGNGRTVAQSEGYKTKGSRDRGIDAVIRAVRQGALCDSTRKGEQ